MNRKIAGVLLAVMFVLFMASNAPAPEGSPCIDVTKNCTDGNPITYEGIVTNCGNVRLSNVTVVDDNGTPGNLSDDVTVLGPMPLAPFTSAQYSGSYTPATSPSTNTVTAKGYYLATPYSDTASDTCSTPPSSGCTLTPGYWQTHSSYGPAPYNDTWASLGENTTFFLSVKTYYEVLWTPPQRGNAYYILAPQYIAAKLNVLAGASVPSNVQTAINDAQNLFIAYTPAEIGILKGDDSLRAEFISLAGLLDDYNNGITGPGHCAK